MEDDTENSILTGILVLLISPIVYFLAILWHGLVLSTLWGWFAPAYTTITMSLPQAMGISLILAMARGLNYHSIPKEDRGAAVVYLFFAPLLILIVGSVVHSYMMH